MYGTIEGKSSSEHGLQAIDFRLFSRTFVHKKELTQSDNRGQRLVDEQARRNSIDGSNTAGFLFV
jgi:hypothetical protein